MILVNAATMESPITTVSRIAENAAAAIVPMTYSTALNYTSSKGRIMSDSRWTAYEGTLGVP
jgi:hypothetical protein